MSFYLAHLGVEGFSVLYSIYQLASVYITGILMFHFLTMSHLLSFLFIQNFSYFWILIILKYMLLTGYFGSGSRNLVQWVILQTIQEFIIWSIISSVWELCCPIFGFSCQNTRSSMFLDMLCLYIFFMFLAHKITYSSRA